jgi:hypothetical protein
VSFPLGTWIFDGRRFTMKRAILYPLGMIGAAASGLFALYATLYWGWLTATPLTEAQLSRARYNAYVWLSMFVGSSAMFVILLICWARGRRTNRAQSGAVPDRGGI